jgi:hypothetical protein
VQVSLFQTHFGAAHTWEGTWEAFVADLGPHVEYPMGTKEAGGLPAFSPTTYRGGVRLQETALAVNLGALDLDGVTDAQLLQAIQVIESRGLAACLYSTWSHPKEQSTTGKHRVRLLVPFDAPVEARDWDAFYMGRSSPPGRPRSIRYS